VQVRSTCRRASAFGHVNPFQAGGQDWDLMGAQPPYNRHSSTPSGLVVLVVFINYIGGNSIFKAA
jgi:hypothetical protein